VKSLYVLLLILVTLSNAVPVATVAIPTTVAAVESLPPPPPPPQAPTSPELQKKLAALNLMLDSGHAQAGSADVAPVSEPNFAAIALRLAISLAVVLLLIYALYRLARRVRKMDLPPSEGGKALQMLENYYLGSQQKVILMRVGENRVILVGVTQESMQTLSVIEGEEAKTMLANANAALVTPAQFSETVSQMLSRFRKDDGK